MEDMRANIPTLTIKEFLEKINTKANIVVALSDTTLPLIHSFAQHKIFVHTNLDELYDADYVINSTGMLIKNRSGFGYFLIKENDGV